jgi:SAM-dependent methyltransferase
MMYDQLEIASSEWRRTMPEYDDFAETYQQWSGMETPYSIVEAYTFLQVLGSVQGLSVLDLAAGEGRTSRMLIELGAISVVGADISSEMVRRASEQNMPQHRAQKGERIQPLQNLSFIELDAADDNFQLDAPVDVVTAMYLFHYAPIEAELGKMADLIARNLKPGGRFVTYTISPDYDFSRREPLLMERCGFDYSVVAGPHCELLIGGDKVDIWQWSREAHEASLRDAGFADIRWHPLRSPPDVPEVDTAMDFYLANPSCIVLSATLPS